MGRFSLATKVRFPILFSLVIIGAFHFVNNFSARNFASIEDGKKKLANSAEENFQNYLKEKKK